MKKISINEQKKIMLEALLYVDEFCKENNLTYYLAGGTLIGAIRHKGFIPWDDDVDIFMLRKDYEKLIGIFNENSKEQYTLLSRENNTKFYLPYAKIIDNRTIMKESVHGIMPIGANIDVFPLDYIEENDWYEVSKKISNVSVFEWIMMHKSILLSKSNPLWKNAIIVFLRIICPFPYYYLAKYREKRLKKYISNTPTKRIVNLYGAWGTKETATYDAFAKTIKVDFEGYQFLAPIGYDEWLTNVYGDYMKLPPKEKQNTHHNYELYWKD